MRTTIDIADDVLQAARERARHEKKTVGQTISELARQALTAPLEPATVKEPEAVYGLRPFASRGGLVTNELIDKLGEEDAYCPITQNGCVRVMSNPSYPNPLPVQAVVRRLAEACNQPVHEFWADEPSLFDASSFDTARIHGPRQVTDVYLLGLAVKRDGVLATFDGRIPLAAVRNATARNLLVL